MNCFKHTQTIAAGQCVGCQAYLCADCINQKRIGSKYMDTCPRCKDLVRRFKEAETKIPFAGVIKQAFIYPLALNDKIKLAGFAVFLIFWAFMKTIMPLNPIIYANWAVSAFLWGVFISYIIKSTKSVGNGNLKLPEWPDFTYYMDDLIIPSIRVSLTSIVLIVLPMLLGFALIAHQLGLGIIDLISGQKTFAGQEAIERQLKEDASKETEKMFKLYSQIYGEKQRKVENKDESPEMGEPNEQNEKELFDQKMNEMFRQEDPRTTFINTFLGSAGFKKAAERMPLVVVYVLFFGILTLIGSLLYPMSYYIAAGYESLKGALNPMLLIQLIRRAPFDYFLLILMLIIGGLVSAITAKIFSAFGLLRIPVLGIFFYLILQLYFSLVSAYMIGMFAYQNCFALGFYKEDNDQLKEIGKIPGSPLEFDKSLQTGEIPKNPHLQKPGGFQPYIELDTPLDDDVAKGREFKKLGELETALAHFNLALEVNPTHPIALRECFKIYLLKDDKPKAENTINRLMNHYTGKDKKNEALILFGEVMGVLPMHTFSQRSQKKIALWLKEICDFKNAVVAYRNYAYRYNNDPWAATSLMEAALLCLNQLKSPPLAGKIFNIIVKNFPKSDEAQKAAGFLKSL